MKHLICLLILISFPIALKSQNVNESLSDISKSIIEQLSAQNKKSIAIVDFSSPNGDISEFGRSLSNKLRINIAKNSRSIAIVNRSVLKNAIAEEELLKDGIINPETAKKIKFIGIEVIILAEISDYGNSFSIEIQLVDTESSNIVGGEILEIPKTENLVKLNNAIIFSNNQAIETSRSDSNEDAIQNVPTSTVTQESDKFLFELINVQRNGQNLICNFRITNHGTQRIISIWGRNGSNSSRIFDNFNGEYRTTEISLLDVKGGNVQKEILSDILIPGKLLFKGVNEEATFLPIIEIVYNCNNKNSVVTFTNVPIVKK